MRRKARRWFRVSRVITLGCYDAEGVFLLRVMPHWYRAGFQDLSDTVAFVEFGKEIASPSRVFYSPKRYFLETI